MLLRNIFYFICKHNSYSNDQYYHSILSEQHCFFFVITSILLSRSSYFNLVFPDIFSYTSMGTLTEISTFLGFLGYPHYPRSSDIVVSIYSNIFYILSINIFIITTFNKFAYRYIYICLYFYHQQQMKYIDT